MLIGNKRVRRSPSVAGAPIGDQLVVPNTSMKLPGAEGAVIPAEKLRDYLLSFEHGLGRAKAAFFAVLGYEAAQWQLLERDLREQHLVADAHLRRQTRWGDEYEIIAELRGPNGRSTLVVSGWYVRKDENFPRFVTAYPQE